MKFSLHMLVMLGLATGIAMGCVSKTDEVDETGINTETAEQQLPTQSCDTEYYSDASMTTAVGGCTRWCNGQLTCLGEKTNYRDVVYCEGCGGGNGEACRTYVWGTICGLYP